MVDHIKRYYTCKCRYEEMTPIRKETSQIEVCICPCQKEHSFIGEVKSEVVKNAETKGK